MIVTTDCFKVFLNISVMKMLYLLFLPSSRCEISLEWKVTGSTS